MRLPAPPPGDWWLDQFCATLRPLEGQTLYSAPVRDGYYRGPLWRFVQESIQQALREELDVLQACSRWYSGAYLLETVPSVLYILCRHAHDPQEAIVRAVNDTVDNDTIGAIVGGGVCRSDGLTGWSGAPGPRMTAVSLS